MRSLTTSPLSSLFSCQHPPPHATYTLSLHDALPICALRSFRVCGTIIPVSGSRTGSGNPSRCVTTGDRKSTRLNSSHVAISYAVFCLKKKKKCRNEYAYSETPEIGDYSQ